MLKRLAVIALFLGTSQAVNLRSFSLMTKKAPAGDIPPELAGPAAEKAKEEPLPAAEVAQKAANAEVQAAAAASAAATSEATAAQANADPILTVNVAHNEPRQKREEVILDPVILAKNAAIAKAVADAKQRVADEPKIKAAREKAEMLLPDPLAPSMPLNPLVTYGKARVASEVPIHNLGNPDLKSVAGPAETDQIGKTVYDASMKGCDETPNPRNILSKDDPSFVPGPLPEIPWPVKVPEGAPPAPPVVNKEIVEIKVVNPDKIPTKQDVADAVAKADKDMEEALKVSGTGKNAADKDPFLQAVKVELKGSTGEGSSVEGTPELKKAIKKADGEIKKEQAKNAEVAKELAAEKEKAAAAEAQLKEDAKKEEEEKKKAAAEAKKKEEEKLAKEAEEKKKADEAKEAAVAKADAEKEKKLEAADKEAAKGLQGDAAAEKKAAGEEKAAAGEEKKAAATEAKAGDKEAAAKDAAAAKADTAAVKTDDKAATKDAAAAKGDEKAAAF